jgi:hypothetical protein
MEWPNGAGSGDAGGRRLSVDPESFLAKSRHHQKLHRGLADRRSLQLLARRLHDEARITSAVNAHTRFN